jgi:chemotaxis response regulator CheB
MGRDGVEGLKAIKAARGQVLAQDEAGVVGTVLPVDEIAERLMGILVQPFRAERHARG